MIFKVLVLSAGRGILSLHLSFMADACVVFIRNAQFSIKYLLQLCNNSGDLMWATKSLCAVMFFSEACTAEYFSLPPFIMAVSDLDVKFE